MRARFTWVWLAVALTGNQACHQKPKGGQVAASSSGAAAEGSVNVPAPGVVVPDAAAGPNSAVPDPVVSAADSVVPEGAPPAPEVAEPVPPMRQTDCDQRGTATRWLASKPRVPLAISDCAPDADFFTSSVREAGRQYCKPWAVVGSRWRGVDAWGQVVGTATVEGSDFYDVTRCHEMYLQPKSVEERAVVYASQRGSWEPPPSVEWKPPARQIAGLHRALEAADSLHIDPQSEADTTDRATRPRLYFRLPVPDVRPDVTADRRTLFAVVGGPYLVIAYVGSDDAWHVAHVDGGHADYVRYMPIAVFDLDGNGFPEIIYHQTDGPSWSDVVLGVNPQDRGSWKRVAESVGGSTA